MVTTKYVINKQELNLLDPFEVFDLIKDKKVTDIEIIRLYNQVNSIMFKTESIKYKLFKEAHSVFIDLVKKIAILQD